jgi:hypothetical protein
MMITETKRIRIENIDEGDHQVGQEHLQGLDLDQGITRTANASEVEH